MKKNREIAREAWPIERNGKLLGKGKYEIIGVTKHEHIVVLDVDYYGVSKYIWR